MRPLFATLLLLASCDEAPPPPREFDGAAALRYVETQLGFGPRVPGSAGHARMAAWLDSLLRTRTDSVIVQRWIHVTRSGDSLPMVNLLARFNPSATTRLLFLAHWDTRPRADASGSSDTTVAVPGANDGGSGVAVLLAMADALKANPPAIGVDLLFVDGEDYGDFSVDKDVLMGSRYYAKNPLPGPRPRYAVLFDMVGDAMLQIRQEGYSLTGAPDIVQLVWKTAERLGYQSTFLNESMSGMTDDHIPLQGIGIPAIDLIDFEYGPNNAYHHTPDDTFDKVSARSLKIVGDVAMALIREHK